jgi:hypothetical protein
MSYLTFVVTLNITWDERLLVSKQANARALALDGMAGDTPRRIVDWLAETVIIASCARCAWCSFCGGAVCSAGR